MSVYDDFYQMALEMLSDPEIRSEATILVPSVAVDENKPWKLTPDQTITEEPVYCFYYKAKNNMVNGTVVQTGQKTVLVQSETSEASLNQSQWRDAANVVWVVKAVEPIEANDKIIVFKILLGH